MVGGVVKWFLQCGYAAVVYGGLEYGWLGVVPVGGSGAYARESCKKMQ